jgi:hypothetical protein
MSIERELLGRWRNLYLLPEGYMKLMKETKELLSQPEQAKQEQEPAAWMYEWYENDFESTQTYCGSEKPFEGEIVQPFNIRPLYASPPKREPLTRQQISVGNQSMLNVTRDAFVKGVKFAEQQHGIGE